jgi:hypothetical protein
MYVQNYTWIVLDKWQKITSHRKHHVAFGWHPFIITIAYLLQLKVDFSSIILNNNLFDVALVNCKTIWLLWFVVTYAIVIYQTKWCHNLFTYKWYWCCHMAFCSIWMVGFPSQSSPSLNPHLPNPNNQKIKT